MYIFAKSASFRESHEHLSKIFVVTHKLCSAYEVFYGCGFSSLREMYTTHRTIINAMHKTSVDYHYSHTYECEQIQFF